MVIFPFSARSRKGFFLNCNHENLVEFSDLRLTWVWENPNPGPWHFLCLMLAYSHPPEMLQNDHLIILPAAGSKASASGMLIPTCLAVHACPHFLDRQPGVSVLCWIETGSTDFSVQHCCFYEGVIRSLCTKLKPEVSPYLFLILIHVFIFLSSIIILIFL